MAYIGAGQNKYTVFPLENYTFGHKAPKIEKQRGIEARFQHLKDKCACCQSCCAVTRESTCICAMRG